jgi:hypothetical protein
VAPSGSLSATRAGADRTSADRVGAPAEVSAPSGAFQWRSAGLSATPAGWQCNTTGPNATQKGSNPHAQTSLEQDARSLEQAETSFQQVASALEQVARSLEHKETLTGRPERLRVVPRRARVVASGSLERFASSRVVPKTLAEVPETLGVVAVAEIFKTRRDYLRSPAPSGAQA